MVFMLLFKLLGRIVSVQDRIWIKSAFKEVSNQMRVEAFRTSLSHTDKTGVEVYDSSSTYLKGFEFEMLH